ncbi:uncharacterized protein LOC143891828 [Tasmannia lanceolata]|uniref:uncharacterized protein LOC143891828 n=1 Tax=Tasmannia lanceolata TaxID=3420 RepID=UPI0040637C88
MGSCFSSQTNESLTLLTAKVISLNGTLQEYLVPIKVSQVLQIETTPCFLCNSDKLYFDDEIPPLDRDEQLQLDQIYFVLPISRIKYPLTASDMATLAVKASLALMEGQKKSGGRKKIRISPVLDLDQGSIGVGDYDEFKRFNKASSGLSRSGSVRKLQTNASRRAKMVYRSFRARLSTIHEGFVSE